MSKEKGADASITVDLKLHFRASRWGPECTVAQVRKQALDNAREQLLKLLDVTKRNGIKIVVVSKARILLIDLETEIDEKSG